MLNSFEIDGVQALIRYDAEQAIFYGTFIGLRSKVVFTAPDIEGLRRQGKLALDAFLAQCRTDGVEPLQEYSGELSLRIHPGLQLVFTDLVDGQSVDLSDDIAVHVDHHQAIDHATPVGLQGTKGHARAVGGARCDDEGVAGDDRMVGGIKVEPALVLPGGPRTREFPFPLQVQRFR